ncbi:MAG: hypothetical protein KF812_09500, partial [Fimbriimonadaceae bacterium]|nr:hypothetical protein [Fimbriimonadaceae bacterium]
FDARIEKIHDALAYSLANQYRTAIITPPARANSTAYQRGDTVSLTGNMLVCAVAGTSAGTAPSMIGANIRTPITDGSVTWLWVGAVQPTATASDVPTITKWTATPGGLSDVILSDNLSKVRLQQGNYYLEDSFDGTRGYAATKASGGSLNGGILHGQGIKISFMSDAPYIGFKVTNQQHCKFYIDGQPLHVGTDFAGTGTSGRQGIALDWRTTSGRRMRRYDLEIEGNGDIYVVCLASIDVMFPPPQGLRMLWLADSWGDTVTEAPIFPNDLPAHIVGRLLGIDDCCSSAIGGCGWIATSGGQPNLQTRLATDALLQPPAIPSPYALMQTAPDPDVIVLPMSVNDDISTSGARDALAAAGVSIYSQLVARFPESIIVVMGLPKTPSPTYSLATVQLAETAVFDAINAVKRSNTMMMPVSNDAAGPWFDGAGNTLWGGSGASGGQNENYFRADKAHLTGWFGQRYYAQRFARAFRDLVGGLS